MGVGIVASHIGILSLVPGWEAVNTIIFENKCYIYGYIERKKKDIITELKSVSLQFSLF